MAPAAGYVVYTAIQGFTAWPAINLPLLLDRTGFLICTRIFAPPADELTLLRLVNQLEHAQPWSEKYPA